MSTYKVIQDIEAEDHILGPLSLRQFIFGIGAALCFYLCYLVASKHAAFLMVLFLPPGLFAAFFAVPFGKDQPTEIWALAKIRFLFKPRRRIWDQSGIKELVTVTVPKKIAEVRTDGLSQTEVRSRLNALANTIDSRGWAVKNVNVGTNGRFVLPSTSTDSDRLMDLTTAPQEVPDYAVQASDDIMDEQSNPIAQQFEQLITTSEQTHKQKLRAMMDQPQQAAPTAQPAAATPQADYWFMNNPAGTAASQPALTPPVALVNTQQIATNIPATTSVVSAEPTADEIALGQRLKAAHDKPTAAFDHMKTILPLDQQQPSPAPVPTPQPQPEPPKPNPAVQQFAGRNDLNIDTIAREAQRTNNPPEHLGDEEVIISLH